MPRRDRRFEIAGVDEGTSDLDLGRCPRERADERDVRGLEPQVVRHREEPHLTRCHMVLVHHVPEIVADLHSIRLLVQPGIEPALVELVVAKQPRVDAVARGRLMEAPKRIRIVPVAARGLPAVHDDDVRVPIRVDQRVGKGHACCSRPDYQVVGLDGTHDPSSISRPPRSSPIIESWVIATENACRTCSDCQASPTPCEHTYATPAWDGGRPIGGARKWCKTPRNMGVRHHNVPAGLRAFGLSHIVSRVEDAEAITEHYESIREEDRMSAGLGQLELLRTQEVLRRHLPAPPARVLDVGGATGVYAEWLIADGYQVHVVDLMHRHVEKVEHDLGSLGVTAEVG